MFTYRSTEIQRQLQPHVPWAHANTKLKCVGVFRYQETCLSRWGRSAPPNPLAAFEASKHGKRGKRKGRKRTKGMEENTLEINYRLQPCSDCMTSQTGRELGQDYCFVYVRVVSNDTSSASATVLRLTISDTKMWRMISGHIYTHCTFIVQFLWVGSYMDLSVRLFVAVTAWSCSREDVRYSTGEVIRVNCNSWSVRVAYTVVKVQN